MPHNQHDQEDDRDYAAKRSFDQTPEPTPEVGGNVDPGLAPPAGTFVIHQHHATRLHFDLRLAMFHGDTPVLVSWAVPKNLPRHPGVKVLAVHVEDHPFDYGGFSGRIPKGNYGAGEVRIFDEGSYDLLEQKPGKLTFRLHGKRLQATYHLIRTNLEGGKEQWLAMLREDFAPPPEDLPPPHPMLATPIKEPFDDDKWAFEPKLDGVRGLGYCDEATRLVSRNGADITVAYPELHKVHEQLVATGAVLDGEIVAMAGGKPSFERLQSRMHVRNPKDVERLSKTVPVSYVVFDLLWLDGRSVVDRPYTERRRLLEETVVPSDFLQVSVAIPTAGTALFAAVKAQGLEGMVAKRLAAPYELGRRSQSWLKVKTVMDADLVIAGWLPGQGNRDATIGALAMAVYEGPQDARTLRFVGNVGTGFTARTLAELEATLAPITRETSPLAPASAEELRRVAGPSSPPHWVEPVLVATVEFRELTSAGKLRAPSFKGLRTDKTPADCTFDDLLAAAGRISTGDGETTETGG